MFPMLQRVSSFSSWWADVVVPSLVAANETIVSISVSMFLIETDARILWFET